ncbi:MAG: aspartyl protease family protein [Saprospiraceae bacterium]
MLSILFSCTLFSYGQVQPYSIDDLPKNKVEIPFEYNNHFIIVNVRFNNYLNTKFIFDTGAEHTIIIKKDILNLLAFDYIRSIGIVGADLSQELKAHLITGLSYETGNLRAYNQPLLVLDEDYFRFEEFTGVQIHGILGANLFRRFIVKIDYKKKVITLTKPEAFIKPGKGATEIPIIVHKNKPYLEADVKMHPDSAKTRLKFLLDSGASLSMMLHTNTNEKIQMPSNVVKGNIGKGLGGYLEGFLGRTNEVSFGKFKLKEIITNFQELSGAIDTSYLGGRNGIIGNQILERFTVTLDYNHSKAYFEPTYLYDKPFEYDKSGLMLAAGGSNLNQFTVVDVLANTPAAEAGIQKGDVLKSINFWPVWLYSLENLSSRLSGREGKKISLKVNREGENLKFQFRLRKIL